MELTVHPLKFVLLFATLVLVQVLVCNNILLFGVGVPFICIYFILALPLNTGLKVMMTSAFFLGFLIDLFGDTLGRNCLAFLILSVVRKPIFYAYMPREDKYINMVPSISSMGLFNYIKYSLTLSAIFSALIFSIELFSFASFGRIIVMIASSTLVTLLLLLAVDSVFYQSKRES